MIKNNNLQHLLTMRNKILLGFILGIMFVSIFSTTSVYAVEDTRESKLIFCTELKKSIEAKAERNARYDSQDITGLWGKNEKTRLDIQILYNEQNIENDCFPEKQLYDFYQKRYSKVFIHPWLFTSLSSIIAFVTGYQINQTLKLILKKTNLK